MRHRCARARAVALAASLGLFALVASGSTLDEAMPQIMKAVNDRGSLSFSNEVGAEVGAFTRISNAVFKPAGDGPFPAIVMVHTCGGIDQLHMRTHAREFLAAGYAVLMQDSFGPRGFSSCSLDRSRVIPAAVGVRDAYDALAHLRSLGATST